VKKVWERRSHPATFLATWGKIEKRQAENDDIDALKVVSINNSKSLLECPTITALVATFDAKAFNDTEL